MQTTTERIRALNDELRTRPGGAEFLYTSGQVCITRGVATRGPDFMLKAVHAVRTFSDFTPDNDPHGEHDFGSFKIDGEQLNWKIDYYDLALEMGSAHPEDENQTRRVMTIMLASEY